MLRAAAVIFPQEPQGTAVSRQVIRIGDGF